MSEELPSSAERLLAALIEIEDRAILSARLNGCKCYKPIGKAGMEGRTYPYAVFSRESGVGKQYDQIPWKMVHEPGCPMDGQEGIG